MKLLKRHIAALEKVFTAEIDGHIPFQSRAKVFEELYAAGYLSIEKRRFGAGWPAVTVTGYGLRHKGRIAYCDWAARTARSIDSIRKDLSS